jgi:hypothetical protein
MGPICQPQCLNHGIRITRSTPDRGHYRLRPLPRTAIKGARRATDFPFPPLTPFTPPCSLLRSLLPPRFVDEHHLPTSLFLCWADPKDFAHPPSCSDHLLPEPPISHAPGRVLPYRRLPPRAHHRPPSSVHPRTCHHFKENCTAP